MKKALFEQITPEEGSSFVMLHNTYEIGNQEQFWHFHPEYEIVYIPSGAGKRFVGATTSHFKDGDLILLGPNIPHYPFSLGYKSKIYEEYVLQFSAAPLTTMSTAYIEFKAIHELLNKAKTGIVFEGSEKHEIGRMIKAIEQRSSFERVLQLFSLLKRMSEIQEKELRAKQYLSVSVTHARRIEKVYELIQEQYDTALTTKQVAEHIGMTVSSFCRFFVKSTGKTFKKALTEIRIQQACHLLATTDAPIATIATDCGFQSISLFNRFFKELILETPASYRKRFSNTMLL